MRDEPRLDPQLTAAFASGALLRPSAAEADLVHLTRTLARLAGVERWPEASPPERELLAIIDPGDHVVFILLDGLGMNLMRKLPSDTFMARHLRRSIRATCPSTTACALTSIATGAWPAQHGVTGWYTHLPERGFTVVTLPMMERFTNRPLSEQDLSPADVLPVAAYHGEMTALPLTLLPTPIWNTSYARYSRGGTEAEGYESVASAVDRIVTRVNSSDRPTYTHLYVPDVDTACHHDGIAADSVVDLILRLDRELGRLRESLSPRARVVITADHGLLDVLEANHLTLWADDPFMELLEVPPTGDARLPIFHVRAGREDEFAEQFQTKYAHAVGLVPSAKAHDLGLFGVGEPSEAARRRFGDFVGIPFRPFTMHYAVPAPPSSARHRVYVAQHGGLTPDELEIPLVVA